MQSTIQHKSINMAAQFQLLVVLTVALGPFATISQSTYDDINFCDPALCKIFKGDDDYVQEPNIACNNDGNLSSNCPNTTEIQDISDYINDILHLHNEKRNVIAMGQVKNMESAVRMVTMKWNDTLQYMAELNCKKCVYAHDKCRNTPNFPHAGQNIGITRSYPNPKTNIDAITQIFNDWFNEHKHTSMRSITNFTGSHGSPIGHFTQVVQDNSIEIGCGLIKWKQLKGSKLENVAYLVCNYAMGNMADQPIYVPGSTASQCTTGNNPNYTGLCSLAEVVSTTVLTQ